jgi:hypothetical protein
MTRSLTSNGCMLFVHTTWILAPGRYLPAIAPLVALETNSYSALLRVDSLATCTKHASSAIS